MTNTLLSLPEKRFLKSYLAACKEFKQAGTSIYSIHDPDKFPDWEETIWQGFEDERAGKNMPVGYVPATTFWLTAGDEFIGVGNIRHRLTPALEKLGGNIGYAIRPTKQKLGYGSLILSLLLPEAAKLSIREPLITCDVNNIGSTKIIEKNGGLFIGTAESTQDGAVKNSRLYRISLLKD